MSRLSEVFHNLKKVTIMVIGDFMLDAYVYGTVKRISPEAPVPIVKAAKQEFLPGGAGNVALNLRALELNVVAVGRIGKDDAGAKLRTSLRAHHVNCDLLLELREYTTPVKSRIIASNQQIVRVDFEEAAALADKEEALLLQLIEEKLSEIDAVAVSDYQKGLLSTGLLQQLIALCRRHQIPVIVDPKGSDFAKYSGATVIKPNLIEAQLAAGLDAHVSLELIAGKILAQTQVDALVITRSEQGISLFQPCGPAEHFPAKNHEVTDVTGAGDTVLAIITLGIANCWSLAVAIQLANLAASIAIEKVGCVQVNLSQLAHRLLTVDIQTKVFNQADMRILKLALKPFPSVLVNIPHMQTFPLHFFNQLRSIKQHCKSQQLIVYLAKNEEEQDETFVEFLASLIEVDWIVVQNQNYTDLQCEIELQAIYQMNSSGFLEQVDFLDEHPLTHAKP